LIFYLIPQALVAGFALGSCAGALLALRRRDMTREVRAAVSAAALVFTLSTAFTLQWVSPAANQAFRVAFTGRPVRPGFAEMSLTELRHEASVAPDVERRHGARRELQLRLTMIATPLALTACFVAWAARFRYGFAIGSALTVGMYVYLSYERSLIRPGDSFVLMSVITWAPVLALFAVACAARLGGARTQLGS
jgi:hypothetical protein